MTTNGHGRKDIDGLVVAALVSGATYEQAANFAGCSKSTVRRRMSDPEFRSDVSDARREMIEVLRGRLLRAAPSAIETLEELAAGATSEAVRLGAAKTIVSSATESRLDPLDGLRRIISIAPRDHVEVVDQVINKVALPLIPAELHDRFWLTLERLANGPGWKTRS
jgi:hypothetical protein